jgi:ChrR Cupin-like domain
MIQLHRVDLSAVSRKGGRVIHLSAPRDPSEVKIQWISKFEKIRLTTGIRNDVYLLQGELICQDNRYSVGSYFSGAEEVYLQAGSAGALVYIYTDTSPSQNKLTAIRPSQLSWVDGAVNGMSVAVLSMLQHQLILVNWRPGTFAHQHDHPYGEEIFVISGELCEERGAYPAGSWIRLYPGSVHAPYSKKGALIMLRNGHLRGRIQ